MTAKLRKALACILEYVEKVKPKTLTEAEGMLALISVIAEATLKETEEANDRVVQ